VHLLGNLTITGHNSSLRNRSFEEKRDRMDVKGKHVGYKNRLQIYAELRDVEKWITQDIIARTNLMVEKCQQKFRLKQ
jgi:hypothetical protein